jgi:hypothetical protein
MTIPSQRYIPTTTDHRGLVCGKAFLYEIYRNRERGWAILGGGFIPEREKPRAIAYVAQMNRLMQREAA